MPSPITLQLGSALSAMGSSAISQAREATNNGTSANPQALAHALQAAADKVTIRPAEDRSRATTVKPRIDGTYSPQTLRAKSRESKAQEAPPPPESPSNES